MLLNITNKKKNQPAYYFSAVASPCLSSLEKELYLATIHHEKKNIYIYRIKLRPSLYAS